MWEFLCSTFPFIEVFDSKFCCRDTSVAEYYFHIAKLNQLLVLSQQLEEDIRHLGSHKYIAHQLSVIYVRMMNYNHPLLSCALCKMCAFCFIPQKFALCYLMSVLQQVLSSFRGIQVFSEIKKDIEANFKQMKQSLVVEEGSRHEPQLAVHYINWWVYIEIISRGWGDD